MLPEALQTQKLLGPLPPPIDGPAGSRFLGGGHPGSPPRELAHKGAVHYEGVSGPVSHDNGRKAGFCWGTIVAKVIHPIDVQIIEALRWIEQPLSAGDLAQLFNDGHSWAKIGRHLRRLAKLDAIEISEPITLRKAIDVRYRLVVAESDGPG